MTERIAIRVKGYLRGIQTDLMTFSFPEDQAPNICNGVAAVRFEVANGKVTRCFLDGIAGDGEITIEGWAEPDSFADCGECASGNVDIFSIEQVGEPMPIHRKAKA